MGAPKEKNGDISAPQTCEVCLSVLHQLCNYLHQSASSVRSASQGHRRPLGRTKAMLDVLNEADEPYSNGTGPCNQDAECARKGVCGCRDQKSQR